VANVNRKIPEKTCYVR